MFDKILVPVDLTPKNARAIEMAAGLSGEHGEVTLLHVVETLDLPWEEVEDFYEQLEDRAWRRMEELAEPLRSAGVDFDLQVSYGPRAEQVVDHARDGGHDVIVLSSHRVDPENPGAGWATLSYKVAILAQCPVLLVK